MGEWVIYSEDAGSTFPCSVSTLLSDYTISHPKRQQSS